VCLADKVQTIAGSANSDYSLFYVFASGKVLQVVDIGSSIAFILKRL
jgi:hypothetical protein